jgi:hypothetical protein
LLSHVEFHANRELANAVHNALTLTSYDCDLCDSKFTRDIVVVSGIRYPEELSLMRAVRRETSKHSKNGHKQIPRDQSVPDGLNGNGTSDGGGGGPYRNKRKLSSLSIASRATSNGRPGSLIFSNDANGHNTWGRRSYADYAITPQVGFGSL